MTAPGQPRRRTGTVVLVAAGLAALALSGRAVVDWHRDPIASAKAATLAALVATGGLVVGVALQRGRDLLRSLRTRRRLLRVGLAAMATMVALGAAEGFCRVRAAFAAATDVDARPRSPFVEHDAALGYRPVQARAIDVDLVRTRDGAVLRTVRYTFDAKGHRVTPQPAGDRDRAVVFLGCSHTFGQGLDDADTVPAQYAAARPRDLVQNLAVPGYGPHHALVLLGEDGALDLPPLPHPPVAVYLWIDHHLARLCGSLRVRNTFGIDAPCFELDAHGHARLLGPFRTAEPWRTAMCWALGKSELLMQTGYDWPGDHRDQDLDLAAAVFTGIRDRLAARGARLLIAGFPGQTTLRALAQRLAGSDITCVSLDGVFDPRDPAMHLDDKGHPSPAAAKLLGARLAIEVPRAFP